MRFERRAKLAAANLEVAASFDGIRFGLTSLTSGPELSDCTSVMTGIYQGRLVSMIRNLFPSYCGVHAALVLLVLLDNTLEFILKFFLLGWMACPRGRDPDERRRSRA
jgi:hypothetical protein